MQGVRVGDTDKDLWMEFADHMRNKRRTNFNVVSPRDLLSVEPKPLSLSPAAIASHLE